MEKYKGKPTIVVNVATNCGFTKSNYKQLNELYAKYEEKGLRIAAFPCNQFLNQESGCDVDIKEFAKKNNVQFDMYSKIDVNGLCLDFKVEHVLISFLLCRRKCNSSVQVAQVKAGWHSWLQLYQVELYQIPHQ